jgi:hypothetical protein
MEVLVGAKLYLFMWSALFLIGTSTLSPGALERIWKALLWIAVLQLPVALLQRVFIVPRREAGATRLDSVVGTFSGNIAGGGSSGALALFLVVALVLAAALWRRGLLRGGAFFALAACAFFTIALAEVKVVIVLLPLAFILLFFKELRTRPAVFAGIALACTLLVGAVLAVYQWQAWGTGQFGAQRTLSQNLQASLGYVLDPNNINRYTGEVGRVAALNLWWKHPHRTVFDVLFGYGMASCHASTVSLGALAKQYLPLNLPANTLAALLWDTGALGALAFCAVLGFGALSAIGCLRARQLPPFHGAALETSAVGLVLIGVTLAYNRDMLYTPSIQLLLMLMLGQVLYWRIRRPRRTA